MTVHRLSDMTWPEVRDLPKDRLVAVLPVGAVEAHGPHLPISTDVIIAEAMARSGSAKLSDKGREVLLLPTIAYSAAEFGAAFAGTVPLRVETAAAVLVDIARGLAAHGVSTMAIANAHLDPAHFGSIYSAVKTVKELRIVFPDITRKPWGSRLTPEFKSGACHAGQFEGSIVMAERPDLVREEIRKALPPNPNSLSEAIRDGKKTFAEAGGPEAYFGTPGMASAEEGRATIDTLGGILADAVLDGQIL